MDRATFEHDARGAETFRRLADPPEVYYWEGYVRGLRRCYHGEAFGTPAEHSTWSALSSEDPDDSRALRGVGYRAGCSGMPIDQAVHHAMLHAVQILRGLTNRAMAERLGQTERSVELYRQGKRAIRGPVEVILRQLADSHD